MNRDELIQEVALLNNVHPQYVDDALSQIENSYNFQTLNPDDDIDDVDNVVREIPTGEGLSQKEARKLLVSEMDNIIINRNSMRLRKYKKEFDAWAERYSKGLKPGRQPKEPIFVKGFSMKRLNEAVFMARQRGGYKSLLKVAGF